VNQLEEDFRIFDSLKTHSSQIRIVYMNTFKTVLLAILVTVSFFSAAQNNPSLTAKDRAEKLTALMTTKLKLSSDQKTKVTELNIGVALKNEAVLKNTDFSKELKIASIKGNNQGRRDYLKLFLTADQYALFEVMEKDLLEQQQADANAEVLIENENDI